MKKLILLTAGLLATGSAFAGNGIGTVDMVHVESDGFAMFGTTTPLPGTCSWFIDQFRFDSRTPEGKSMLAVVIAAKVAGLPVTVWFNDSTAPGTYHGNGCTYATMAVVTGVGMR